MISTKLTAISPLDGRYKEKLENLVPYFSEFGLIKYRNFVEIEYFFFLSSIGLFSIQPETKNYLKALQTNFSLENAERVKAIETVTNHDVKAIEYFLKEKLTALQEDDIKEWIHFGLTSQDINNTAIPLLWKTAVEAVYLPMLKDLIIALKQLATECSEVALLAKTHGQPASPTNLGKEIMVFVERLENQLALFLPIPYSAKFGGATGNFNAHHIAFPEKNWIELANTFVAQILGLKRMQYTTQIEHYDSFAAHFDAMKRINTILIDFCRDMWTYISMEYFKQKTLKNEVGSSAMPHKVNPIDFENAEGNLGMANALFEFLANKLPISRLQRDLTDSTVLRNIGVPFGHSILSFQSIQKGLSKLLLNKKTIEADLEQNWAVVAEAIQTILRTKNYPNPYEALKELTRGKEGISQADIHIFIDNLSIDADLKTILKTITPHNYTGIFPKF